MKCERGDSNLKSQWHWMIILYYFFALWHKEMPDHERCDMQYGNRNYTRTRLICTDFCRYMISNQFITKIICISLFELCCCMMTSSNGNINRFTGPFCGEFTGHRWIPCTKGSDGELWCFLSAPEPTIEQTMETLVIWDVTALIMTSL